MTTSCKDHIFVVTSTGSGHLYPCIELCHLLSSRNYTITLVLPSNLLPSLPPSFHHHPLLSTAAVFDFRHGPPTPQQDQARRQAGADLEAYLAAGSPVAAVVDFQVAWTKSIFWKFNVPVISFFTFGACAAAMEWGAWKSGAANLNAGEARSIPGLPEEMCVNFHDLVRARGVGPNPGHQPPWVPLIEGSIGLMFNTCVDLERPFLDYLAHQIGLPVWGVGPLLPEQYWNSSSESLILDREIRHTKRETNYTEEKVIQWLDSKPRGSVLYVSFGSEVGPTFEEYPQLAGALEDSNHPFIWVIRPGSGLAKSLGAAQPRLDVSGHEEGYFPHGLANKVEDRGLIINGWAPQLLILSHTSTGGSLSHCGWNSIVEAIGQGVPFLAWPIKGDQLYNAKLVVNYLKIGYMALLEDSRALARTNILEGIERLLGDSDMHKQAEEMSLKLENSFRRKSSEGGLDAFTDVIKQNTTSP